MSYGSSIGVPQVTSTEEPRKYPLPGLTGLPTMRSADSEGLAAAVEMIGELPGPPKIQGWAGGHSSKFIEAAEYSAAMGKAFGDTREANKQSARRARAKNKAQQRQAERRQTKDT